MLDNRGQGTGNDGEHGHIIIPILLNYYNSWSGCTPP